MLKWLVDRARPPPYPLPHPARMHTPRCLRCLPPLRTQRGVHGVDVRLVALLQLRALELEGGGQAVILHAEHLSVQLDRLDKLKALQV